MTRRVWFARDAWFTADPKVETLGDEHGPGGPLLLEEVFALAKLANDGGRVSARYSTLARRAFLKGSREARAVIETCAELGMLTVESSDDRGFAGAIPRWTRWQVADPRNAERQAAARERNAESNGECNGSGRYESPLRNGPTGSTGNTELQASKEASVASGVAGAAQDLFDYWRTTCAHPQAKPGNRIATVKARLKDGYTSEQIRKAIDGAAAAPNVNSTTGKPWDDLELICRNASKLEDFMGRAGSSNGRPTATAVVRTPNADGSPLPNETYEEAQARRRASFDRLAGLGGAG